MHELHHLVKDYEKIIDPFYNDLNFNLNQDEMKINVLLLFWNKVKNKKKEAIPLVNELFKDYIKNINHEKYLKSKNELYPRIEGLKIFLYKNGFINNINDKLSKDIIIKIYSGEVFEQLSEEQVDLFIYSDFMEILPFFDYNKYPETKLLAEDIKTYM